MPRWRFMKNSLPARTGFLKLQVAENGAAAREVRDARATGPRNAIDRFEKRNTVLRAADLRETALNKIAPAATLLFAHGQTTKRAIVAGDRYRADRQRARATLILRKPDDRW